MLQRVLKLGITIIMLSIGLAVSGQSQPIEQPKTADHNLKTYSVGLRGVHFYDIGVYSLDPINERDMKGLNGSKTNFDIGLDLYIEKQFTPLIGLQFGYRRGSISGANQVEYYENSFQQGYINVLFHLSNIDRYHQNSPLNIYALLGSGLGEFDAQQYLITDDVADNTVSDVFKEVHTGLGATYQLNSSFRLEMGLDYNIALTDAFDGYNAGGGQDFYLSTSLGLVYTLGERDRKPMYGVNFFSPQYMNLKPEKKDADQTEKLNNDLTIAKNKVDSLKAEMTRALETVAASEEKVTSLEKAIAEKKSDHIQLDSWSVFFEVGSAKMSNLAKQNLMAKLARPDYKDLKLELIAYADTTGPESLNQELKLDRAEAVIAFLRQLGYNKDQITYNTGEALPLDHSMQHLNRRVWLKIIY